jgi:hypothetical protein
MPYLSLSWVWLIARILQKSEETRAVGTRSQPSPRANCQDSVEHRSAARMKPAPPATIACIGCKS